MKLATVVVTAIIPLINAVLDSRYVTRVESWATLHERVEATRLLLFSSLPNRIREVVDRRRSMFCRTRKF